MKNFECVPDFENLRAGKEGGEIFKILKLYSTLAEILKRYFALNKILELHSALSKILKIQRSLFPFPQIFKIEHRPDFENLREGKEGSEIFKILKLYSTLAEILKLYFSLNKILELHFALNKILKIQRSLFPLPQIFKIGHGCKSSPK